MQNQILSRASCEIQRDAEDQATHIGCKGGGGLVAREWVEFVNSCIVQNQCVWKYTFENVRATTSHAKAKQERNHIVHLLCNVDS